MRVDSCHRGPSLDINMQYKTEHMTSKLPGVMDINALLNPVCEDQEKTMVINRNRASRLTQEGTSPEWHRLPLHQRAVLIEVGGYVQPYPTPANSPVQQYNTTASVIPHDRQNGPLPSVNTLLRYPSPPVSEASVPSRNHWSSSPPNGTREAYYRPSQPESDDRVTNASSMQRQSSQPRNRSPQQSTRQASRSQRNYLYRIAKILPPRSPPKYLEATQRAPSPVEKAKTSSNEAYRTELVHWVRYHKTDLKGNWKPLTAQFYAKYSAERKSASEGGLSSRNYRDALIPMIDDDGKIMYDASGKMLTINVKVREKDIGENKNTPWTCVERHPWTVLNYSWVKPEHKAQAARIIAEIERKSPEEYTRKEQYIVAIREYEQKKESLKSSKRRASFSATSTSTNEDTDMLDCVASPTQEQLEEDYMNEQLYKEAFQQLRLS